MCLVCLMLSILDVALPTLDLKRRILLRYIDGNAKPTFQKLQSNMCLSQPKENEETVSTSHLDK